MSEEYYSVLIRTIRALARDQAQARSIVYQLARVELRKALYLQRFDPQNGSTSWEEIQEQITSLETAIERVESEAVEHSKQLGFSADKSASVSVKAGKLGTALVSHQDSRQIGTIDVRQDDILDPVIYGSRRPRISNEPLPALGRKAALPAVQSQKPAKRSSKFARAALSTLQLAVAVVLGIAVYSAIANREALFSLASHREANPPASSTVATGGDVNQTKPPEKSSTPAVQTVAGAPIPTAYGIYAVDRGKLTELPALPIRVPDPKIGVSPPIPTPGTNKLPDGQLTFVIFQRDLANNAPDKIMVRVVARVSRELKFGASGEPKVVKIDGSWAIRSNAYEMKVIPVDDNPAMIIVQPETPGFSFPPGRYALVLKNTGYDFTVAGEVTDPAHCLELTDAVNMPVYSECRSP
jgi:hypothetical protein